MACFGSKTLQHKNPKTHKNADENTLVAREDSLSNQSKKDKSKNTRPKKKEHLSEDKSNIMKKKTENEDYPSGEKGNVKARRPKNEKPPGKKGKDKNRKPKKQNPSGNSSQKEAIALKSSAHHTPSVIRKRVDPETAKYFTEIANLFEGGGIDLDERSIICGNTLEETRGKELELATDAVLSRLLQTLLEGCDVSQLCGFLQSCAQEFPVIAVDKFGSHVVETALKSVSLHLQDNEAYAGIEDTMTKILQVIVVKPVDVMCSLYGSHVLRSLLCLCKGVPLDSSGEFHVTKSSTLLAERLNTQLPHSGGDHFPHLQQGLSGLLKFLVSGILKYAKEDIEALRVNKYSSFVLQTALKLLVGDDEELLHVISILLGCHVETIAEQKSIETTAVQEIMDLLKDTAYSHLMEVILEVAPESLYDIIFTSVFRGSLFDISSHHCGSFVVQALISSARSQGHIDLIWEELGPKVKNLLMNGKSGVVASLLAACQRFHTHGRECCQALAAAVCSGSESPNCIVPRILFLDAYFRSEDKSSWNWLKGDKMHTLGCLMLQTIFKYSSQYTQLYISSILSMEPDQVIEAAKDAGGGRVLESFLSSDASAKYKNKVTAKFEGYFGELSMHPSSSYTVEKCFAAGTVSLKEVIASELLAVQSELSKTKHGPYILRKIDIDGFARRRDQWKSRLSSKQTTYKEFTATFGSETISKNNSHLAAQPSFPSTSQQNLKKMRKEIDQCLETSQSKMISGSEFPGLDASMAKLGFSNWKRPKIETKKHIRNSDDSASMDRKKEERRKSLAADNATWLSKHTKSAKVKKRQFHIDGQSKPLKKQKI